jgi:hypothetical protein
VKEAIITIVSDSVQESLSTDEEGQLFPVTFVFRVEFEGTFKNVISASGDHITTITKVVACEQLGAK